MDTSLYLQIISIFMAVIAVAIPSLIAIVGYVYIRTFTERMDNISDSVDQLWDRVKEISPESVESEPGKPSPPPSAPGQIR